MCDRERVTANGADHGRIVRLWPGNRHGARGARRSGLWDDAARRVERIAAAVRDETRQRTVFQHHSAGYVETPAEIDALMARTDPSLVGLCLDSGHATYGGGAPLDLLARHRARTWHGGR